jgi:putative ABC transport system ATP-binding protein
MPPLPSLALECRGVSRRFQSGTELLTVLDGVDLAVAQGESLAIVGPSGSGKSTLLGLMAGLDRPSAGSVLIDGAPIERLSEDALALLRRDKLGFVFQSYQLLGHLTARENVLLPLELRRVPDRTERTARLLESVGLASRGQHYPSTLSGGEQQRVALARAFAAEPRILLADEPTGNLDTRTGARVLDLLFALQAERGTTLVLVTHDAALAARADRVVHMDGGRLRAEAP